MSIFDLFKKLDAEKKPPAGPPEWLIVGLGNPGKKYECTRHNVGWLALETLAGMHRISISQLKFSATVGQGTIANTSVLLMKPQTYMNESGRAVREAANFYHIPPERVLVMYDDVSMTPGKLRIRAKGSAGGHNGIKSIIAQLGSDVFPRIKLGVGAPPHPEYDLADWVLGTFTNAEQEILAPCIDRACASVPIILTQGCAAAANQKSGA
ncbi:MAG: aminoacyl-tRNA hydrolase [Ruminococcaceae bacterium]|nr:aminoacyl-tRNA hydrolase [Oscillospiraceae bacterium]